MSHRKILWSLGGARFGFRLFQSLWTFMGTSTAAQPRCLSHFRAMCLLSHPISRLRDFTKSYAKTSFRFMNRDPVFLFQARTIHQGGLRSFIKRLASSLLFISLNHLIIYLNLTTSRCAILCATGDATLHTDGVGDYNVESHPSWYTEYADNWEQFVRYICDSYITLTV